MKYLITVVLFLSYFSVMGQKFHTEFKYTDVINKGILIQNSYPKGGQEYTARNGKKYVFVVFWTRITNETNSDLEITINFPIDSFKTPSSPDVNFNIYVPKEEMKIEKETLLNYGLDLKSFLDKNIEKPSELVKTICQNESYLFYNIALSNEGIIGVVRAGFELKRRALFYKINDYEIICGKIEAKK